MRIVIAFLLISLFNLSAFSQEMYKVQGSEKELLFLGAINSGKLKVWCDDEIKYITKDSLEQVGQLSFRETFERFESEGLQITASGYEPFWNLKFKGNTITGIFVDKEISTTIQFFYPDTLGWGWSMMFGSGDNRITGLIHRPVSGCYCEFEIEEDTSFYEIFVCVGGTVYEGCVFVNKK